jgi:hypothetical protein
MQLKSLQLLQLYSKTYFLFKFIFSKLETSITSSRSTSNEILTVSPIIVTATDLKSEKILRRCWDSL